MLIRKMLREVRLYKSQFFAIFMMMFLGVFIFSGVNAEYYGMQAYSEKFYKDSVLADVWVYGSAFYEEDIQKVKEIDGVQNVSRRSVVDTNVKDKANHKISLYLIEDEAVSKMQVTKGKSYTSTMDGIWIDEHYAKKNQLKLGDEVTLEMNGIRITQAINGFILHPEMVYQGSSEDLVIDHRLNGYAFINTLALPFQDKIPFTQLLISTKNPTRMEDTISKVLQHSNLTFLQREDQPSYSTLQSEINQHKAFASVFPIVFLLIALLTTMTTLSRILINQRLQIGILKALGFQNQRVCRHYISHVIFIIICASLLGLISGPMVVPALMYPMMKTMYSLPILQSLPKASSYIVVIGCILVCTLISYIVTRKQLKENSAALLRGKVMAYKKAKEKNGKFWSHFRFYTQWNVRDIVRNKLRSLIAVLGVAGCMGLMLCAFGMQDSMSNFTNVLFNELQTYEMRVSIDETADIKQIQQAMKASLLEEGGVELQFKDSKKTGSITIQEDTTHIHVQNTKRKEIDLPKKGVLLSYNLANTYDIHAGDVITWRLLGTTKWIKSQVKDIIHTPMAQGITMSKQVYEDSGFVFQPTSMVGNRADVSKDKGVVSIRYLDEDISKGMEDMLEAMNILIAVLILAASILGIVVLYNIGTFSYLEKMRDMATLKVLGFQDKQVKKLMCQQNLWLTFMGIMIGIPFGYGLIYTVISTISEQMDLRIYLRGITLLGCSLCTLLVSSIVIHIVVRKTKKIDMVSALKEMQ